MAATTLISITNTPAGKLTPKGRNDVARILTTTPWFGDNSSCGHFGRWLEDVLYSRLGWAAGCPGDGLLDAFVTTWFGVSVDMLAQPHAYCGYCQHDPHRHSIHRDFAAACFKARTMEHDEWLRRFWESMQGDDRIALLIARQFTGDVRALQQNRDFVIRSAHMIGARAQKHAGLRLPFLGLANAVAQAEPADGLQFLDTSLNLVRDDPSLVPYLGRLVCSLPYKGNENRFQRLHAQVNEIVDNCEVADQLSRVASIRKAQEGFVPHLFGRSGRLRHKAGNPGVSARVLVRQGDRFLPPIAFSVFDVAVGDDHVTGRGLLLQSAEWRFGTDQHLGPMRYGPSELHLNTVHAKVVVGGTSMSIVDPEVELTWPGGSLKSASYSIRGFDFAGRHRDLGGGLVLFLRDQPSCFCVWQDYVRKVLIDVDYGAAGAP